MQQMTSQDTTDNDFSLSQLQKPRRPVRKRLQFSQTSPDTPTLSGKEDTPSPADEARDDDNSTHVQDSSPDDAHNPTPSDGNSSSPNDVVAVEDTMTHAVMVGQGYAEGLDRVGEGWEGLLGQGWTDGTCARTCRNFTPT